MRKSASLHVIGLLSSLKYIIRLVREYLWLLFGWQGRLDSLSHVSLNAETATACQGGHLYG
jgi:hypothetical protein